MTKASELLLQSAVPFDQACMMVREMEQELNRLHLVLDAYQTQNSKLKQALIKHRERLFPGTDQGTVIERDYPTPNIT